MLSRVAERVYWTARYLERAESTARLIKVYANLLLDLPREVNFGWYNLIILNSSTESFGERYKNRDERNVVKFMLADKSNSMSLLSSLAMVRENVRTTRDTLPMPTWELVNELSLYATKNIQQGINRSNRQAFLDEIIKDVQRINGLFYGVMSHDAGWEFLRLGRNIERADMTTRILDAGASALLQASGETSADIAEILWGNVLSSLSGYMPYRRSVRTSVVGSSVARYLIENRDFPRAFEYCMMHMYQGCRALPRHQSVQQVLDRVSESASVGFDYDQLGEPFRDYLNELQLGLIDVHSAIEQAWFSVSD